MKTLSIFCEFFKAVGWVFYRSKDKSLEMCSDVAQEDVKQDKDKEK